MYRFEFPAPGSAFTRARRTSLAKHASRPHGVFLCQIYLSPGLCAAHTLCGASRAYEKLYEDIVDGKVTDAWFMQLSHRYDVERLELKAKIADCRGWLNHLESAKRGRDLFLRTVRRFMEIQTLTAPLLQELIDHIDVYETDGSGKNRTQRIKIFYRFVGYIDLTAEAFVDVILGLDGALQSNYTADTRRGVRVEYLPGQPQQEQITEAIA